MEGLVGSGVCQRVRSCWARRRGWTSYQRLIAAPPTPTPRRLGGRGFRLSRRTTVLGSAARRFGRRLRRGAASARWASPLQLLQRVVDAYVSSLLSQPPLKVLGAGVTSPPGVAAPAPTSKLRRDASPPGSSRRRDGGGRGVVLNLCVAEALLLRRSTSEVRPSPLQQAREAARCASVRAA